MESMCRSEIAQVSIHTPAKGVTGLSSDYFAKADVSIHTPAKGVTSSSAV